MGTNQSRINNDCPITLESLDSSDIVLHCGHGFNRKAIQEYVFYKYIVDKKLICPLCRGNITNKEIRKIFKKFYLVDANVLEWRQKNLLSLYMDKRTDFKFNILTTLINNEPNILYQILFKINGNYILPLLETSIVLHFRYINTILNKKRIYLEENNIDINNCIKAKCLDTHYEEFIARILKKFFKQYFNQQLYYKIESKRYEYIYFYINKDTRFSQNEINHYNKSIIQFVPYLLNYNNKIYFLNLIKNIEVF